MLLMHVGQHGGERTGRGRDREGLLWRIFAITEMETEES